MSRINEVLKAGDRLFNALAGGYSTELFSSRCWRLRKFQPYGILRRLIDGFFFWQPNHCRKSFENEWARANTPPEYLGQSLPTDTP